MNKYQVDRIVYVTGDREKETLCFDAYSISFLSGDTNVLLVFHDIDGETIGAVDGFETVRLIEPDEPTEPEVLKDHWGQPLARPELPDTMAA